MSYLCFRGRGCAIYRKTFKNILHSNWQNPKIKPKLFSLGIFPPTRSISTTTSLLQFRFSKAPPNTRPLPKTTRERNRTTLLYLVSAAIATVGASYAAVPLYRVFCQSTSYGGTVKEVGGIRLGGVGSGTT